MALKSSKKRIRQNEKRRVRNRRYLSSSRTLVKKAKEAIAAGNLEEATKATRLATQSLDKAASKGVIHKNNASRRKSRLMKSLASLEKEA